MPVSEDQRAALARAHQQVCLAGKDGSDGESARQVFQRGFECINRVHAFGHVLVDQLCDDFAVCLRLECSAPRLQVFTQLAEILDDAIVHNRDLA